ncbi:hypothetical protein DFH09DRAFT_124835 [Mycena vulgaris]|nr:hypothetical protein DFH09DRAFT_124835 [Mycena vulgaris]
MVVDAYLRTQYARSERLHPLEINSLPEYGMGLTPEDRPRHVRCYTVSMLTRTRGGLLTLAGGSHGHVSSQLCGGDNGYRTPRRYTTSASVLAPSTQGSWGQRRAQHTLSNAPPKTTPTKGPPRRTISTLTPELLQPADFLDLAGSNRRRVTFPLSAQGSDMQLAYFRHGPSSSMPRAFIPFPAHARGFLYFAPQLALSTLASSVRFRCTPSEDPASFAAGNDLALPNGLPWQILLAQAVISTQIALRAQLLHEGHLTAAGIAQWKARVGMRVRTPPAFLLFGPNQLFVVNFARSLTLTVVGDTCFYNIELVHIFANHAARVRSFSYEGTALAHFALSPTDPHLVHLHITKLLEPPVLVEDSPRIVRPLANVLFSVYTQRGSPASVSAYRIGSTSDERSLYAKYADYDHEGGEPWAFDMRACTPTGEAFRVLFGREYLENTTASANAVIPPPHALAVPPMQRDDLPRNIARSTCQ